MYIYIYIVDRTSRHARHALRRALARPQQHAMNQMKVTVYRYVFTYVAVHRYVFTFIDISPIQLRDTPGTRFGELWRARNNTQ